MRAFHIKESLKYPKMFMQSLLGLSRLNISSLPFFSFLIFGAETYFLDSNDKYVTSLGIVEAGRRWLKIWRRWEKTARLDR